MCSCGVMAFALHNHVRSSSLATLSRKRTDYSARFLNTDLAKQAPDDCKYPNEWPKNRSPYFRAFFATFGDFDWRNDLNGLKIPRLIIHGREDRVPFEGGKAWAEGYTDARLIVVSPSGHFPFIEQKEVVLAAIETFLDGDWPQDAIVVQSDNDLQ